MRDRALARPGPALHQNPHWPEYPRDSQIARGGATERSDVDLLVALTDPSAARVAQLTGRLERRLGRDVQIVRLQDAQQTPSLMADALEQGRVLIDRDNLWRQLKGRETTWRRRARASDVPLEDAMPDLDLS